jgi:tetratricopeptide (TPR) repeat protein
MAESAAALSSAIARDSSYAPAWTALAKTYIRAEEREFGIPGVPRDSLLRRAVQAVNRSLFLDPESADGWLTQAIVTARVDPTDFTSPLQSARKSVALDSLQPVAWHFLARFLAETGDLDQAMQSWRRAVAVGPKYSQGLAFLGLAHYWRRNYDSAAKWTDSALATEPNYLLGLSSIGQVAVEQGRYTRAIGVFRAAGRLTTEIEFVNSLAGEALALARSGNRGTAQRILERADSLANGYRPAPLHTAVYLAHAYAALVQPNRAIGWLKRYQTPSDLHFQLHLRCDPPLEPLHGTASFRELVLRPLPPAGGGC